MIAVAGYHGPNEGGEVSEKEDVMDVMEVEVEVEVVRVNNQVVPRKRTVQVEPAGKAASDDVEDSLVNCGEGAMTVRLYRVSKVGGLIGSSEAENGARAMFRLRPKHGDNVCTLRALESVICGGGCDSAYLAARDFEVVVECVWLVLERGVGRSRGFVGINNNRSWQRLRRGRHDRQARTTLLRQAGRMRIS
jgi:hypothetical protein